VGPFQSLDFPVAKLDSGTEFVRRVRTEGVGKGNTIDPEFGSFGGIFRGDENQFFHVSATPNAFL
jgi:hypothetical protein